MKTLSAFISLTLLFLISKNLFAEDISLSSKGKQTIFIELFTSQGCSSCPPAEEYLNEFESNESLWSKYIPIAFHVDYWDYIGWKDVFARKDYVARQYRYAKLKHVRTVYTPAFVVNGNAWRKGFFSSYPQVSGLKNGELDVTVTDDVVSSSYTPNAAARENLKMNIAVLGMDMVVKISAGENEGRTSKHSFVVLGYNSQLSENRHWKMKLPDIKETVTAKRYALVVWVTNEDDPTPLQAVGSWFKLN